MCSSLVFQIPPILLRELNAFLTGRSGFSGSHHAILLRNGEHAICTRTLKLLSFLMRWLDYEEDPDTGRRL